MRIIFILLSLVAVVSGQATFCQNYTKALFTNVTLANQYSLINAVVTRAILGCSNTFPSIGGNCTNTQSSNVTVIGLLDTSSMNRGFFDGTSNTKANQLTGSQSQNALAGIPVGTGGSTRFANFSSNSTYGNYSGINPSASFLITHLVEFFGVNLGCDLNTTASTSSIGGIGVYGGIANMTRVHQDMVINNTVWQGFVNALVGTLTSYGVSDADITRTVIPFAQSFLRASSGSKVICNQPDCACATGFNGTNCDAIVTPTSTPTTPAGNGTTSPPTTPAGGNGTTSTPTTPAGGNGTTIPPTSAPTTPSNGTSAPTTTPGTTTCTIVRESATPNNASCIQDDCAYKCGNTLTIITTGTSTALTLGPVTGCTCPTGRGTISNIASITTMNGDVDGTPYSARVANNRLTSIIADGAYTCAYQYKLTSGTCLGLTPTSGATTATVTSFITTAIIIVAAVFTF